MRRLYFIVQGINVYSYKALESLSFDPLQKSLKTVQLNNPVYLQGNQKKTLPFWSLVAAPAVT